MKRFSIRRSTGRNTSPAKPVSAASARNSSPSLLRIRCHTIHRSELSIRPVWHQRADRVQAHILVCFLAYMLWKTLEQWQSRAGLGNSPRTILDEPNRIQSVDVVLPLAVQPHRQLRIRCVVRPD